MQRRRVLLLAGGVGGARLARGFNRLPDVDLTVVVNVGDDTWMHGVYVAADLDTVLYTLAGIEGPHGWGRAGDTFAVMDETDRLGGETRFKLGDKDLAFNLLRTSSLRNGEALSGFAVKARQVLGIRATVLPASDDPISTQVLTDDGWIGFQDYFVARGHQDRITDIRFAGAESCVPAPGVIDQIRLADLVVIAPSNPILSIWPILSIHGIKEAVVERPLLAVSPLIGTDTVKGPAAENLACLGFGTGHHAVISAYDRVIPGMLRRLAIHHSDRGWSHPQVDRLVTNTLISDPESATVLSKELLEWAN